MILQTLRKRLQAFWSGNDGSVANEAAILFPVMLMMLMGTYDISRQLLMNQKVINASQISADLISRYRQVDMAIVDDTIQAGMLAMDPFGTDTFGIDMVSIRFDENLAPEILWRETRNMLPNDAAVDSLDGLGREGEGMIIVTVRFDFDGMISEILHDGSMQEVAFARGRRTPTVTMDGWVPPPPPSDGGGGESG